MQQPQYINYTNNFQMVRQSGSVPSNCNGITFINTGTDNVDVMGYVLQPSYTLALNGNVGEMDVTNYTIKFAGGAGLIKALLVITKTY